MVVQSSLVVVGTIDKCCGLADRGVVTVPSAENSITLRFEPVNADLLIATLVYAVTYTEM